VNCRSVKHAPAAARVTVTRNIPATNAGQFSQKAEDTATSASALGARVLREPYLTEISRGTHAAITLVAGVCRLRWSRFVPIRAHLCSRSVRDDAWGPPAGRVARVFFGVSRRNSRQFFAVRQYVAATGMRRAGVVRQRKTGDVYNTGVQRSVSEGV
jgi:hypothetical protein